MISVLNAPFLIFFVGAALAMLLPLRIRRFALLITPVLGLVNLLVLDQANDLTIQWLDMTLVLVKIDSLSFIFGVLFHIACFIAIIFAWHVENKAEQAAALLYPGSALGVVFAGDFLTVFVFWELLALTSVFFIIARGTQQAVRSAIRYLVFQVLSGVLLLVGVVMLFQETSSLLIGPLDLQSAGGLFFLLAFGIKAAFPLMHNWLTDAYPEATASGTVFLSAFTTKVAVYMLARTFTGLDELIYIGAVMACFPIFYAVIENDLRRVLAYSMINQIGFMVCGIGIGTELAVNGAVAHAFNDVLFKGLLMMSMGAVLFRTGEMRGSELGGLAKSMPKTAGLCIVGAASISAFPLFSGFVSKSMVMAALLIEHHEIVWFAMLFASAGVFHHAGIKIPYFAFFAHDSDRSPQEAPRHMLIAMSLAATACIVIGCFPELLYQHLPYTLGYSPFDAPHVLEQLQLLFFSALAFIWLQLAGIYPAELRSTNIDADWSYRKVGPKAYAAIVSVIVVLRGWFETYWKSTGQVFKPRFKKLGYDLLIPWRVQTMLIVLLAVFTIILLSLHSTYLK